MNTISFLAFGGAIEFIMIPFRTLATTLFVSALEAITPYENFTSYHHAFCLLHGSTKDIILHGDNPQAQDIAFYWQSIANLSILEKWDVFQFAFNEDMLATWLNAYRATRAKPTAPEILQGGEPTTDDEQKKSGG